MSRPRSSTALGSMPPARTRTSSSPTWEATDSDGPTHISLTMLKVADNKLLMLTYWGSEAGEKSNVADLQSISGSIKPIK